MKVIALLAFALLTNTSHGKENMKYEITVQKLEAQSALVMKGTAKAEQVGEAIGSRIGAVSAFLEKSHINPIGAPFTRIYSFENGVFEFEAGFPVAPATKGNGEIIATELPAAEVAATMHIGDQATSEEAYAAIHAWMKSNSREVAGAPWEVYFDETTMQIFYPIR